MDVQPGTFLGGHPKRERGGIEPWLFLGASVLIWLIPFGLAGFLFLVFHVAGPLFLALGLYLLYRLVVKWRQFNGQMIIEHLDLAVRLNLPIASFLRAAGLSESGSRARQIRHVVNALENGSSLADAMAEARDVSDAMVARLRASESLGQVRVVLGKSVQEDRRVADDAANMPDPGFYRVYIAFMCFAIPCVVLFLMIFIVPKFKEIFKDFKTTLPTLTEYVIRVSSLLSEDLGLVTGAILIFIGLVFLLFMSYWASRIFLPSLPLPDFRGILSTIGWRVPVARTLLRDRAMAETCTLLASATHAGISLPAALEQAQKLPLADAFRRQLEDFRARLIAGGSPADAADAAGLPQLMAGLLAPASNCASDPELFAFLERYYRNRFSRLQATLYGALGPVLVLSFGAIVGTIVVAMFLPLVKLLASAAGWDGGGVL